MITHPFVDHSQLQSLSLEELQNKITELNKRRLFVMRTNNQPMINQLNMIIQSHTDVYNSKVTEQWQKMNINSKVDVSHSDNK